MNVNNDDIRAFGAEPAATAASTAPRRRARWPWVLGAALLLMVLLLAAGTVAAWVVNEGISIVVDGHRWDDLLPEHAWAAVVSLGLTGALIVGALLMCVGLLLPLVLSLVFLIVGLVVAVAQAAVGVALAVALSPLWLPLLLLWLLLRPSRPPLASSSA